MSSTKLPARSVRKARISVAFKSWCAANGLTVVAPLDVTSGKAACWFGTHDLVTVKYQRPGVAEAQFITGPYTHVLAALTA